MYHTNQAHKKCAQPPPTFHTFNLFMEGDFLERGETYEQTTRLSGYVRTNSATNGGQAKNFFAVIQQQRIR